jgi:hypothetical protein
MLPDFGCVYDSHTHLENSLVYNTTRWSLPQLFALPRFHEPSTACTNSRIKPRGRKT